MYDQLAAEATRWARVKPSWRAMPRQSLPLAFQYLKKMLSADEYERMAQQWQSGHREVQIENGFVVTCLIPHR